MQSLKKQIEIISLIEQFVKLKRTGSTAVGLCPFHQEKTPSFNVSNDKGIYKCFGCGKNGDVIQFVMEHQSKSYYQAITFLADKYNIELDLKKKVYERPVQRLTKLSESNLKYFELRGISNNTLLRFNVTESLEYMPKAQAEVPAICFNYYRDEELINIKYRAKDKDFKLAKNAELIFYNIDAIKDTQSVIIVEGEIDALTLYECGYYNVVSVPNGAGNNLQYLDNCYKYFENKTKVIIATDNDEPGNNLCEELARRIGKEKCYKVTYPDDCKDINDVLVKHSKAIVDNVVNKAECFPIEGIHTMDDMYEDVCNYYLNGYPKGSETCITGLDQLLTFAGGQITMVTGVPGSGKSEFLDYIMTKLAMNHRWNWGVCSFENQPSAFHVTKLQEKVTGKAFQFRDEPEYRLNEDEFRYSIGVINEHFSFININKVDVTVDGIIDKARELVHRKGIKGLIIDPWNYIEHKVSPNQTETQYISESLTKFKAFALLSNIHIFIVAHPTKIAKSKDTGEYEVPTLYNISGSAHFFNKTDNGICIHRSFKPPFLVTCYVQKVRYSWLGRVGNAAFTYDIKTRQYLPSI
jgi:twinkle protein